MVTRSEQQSGQSSAQTECRVCAIREIIACVRMASSSMCRRVLRRLWLASSASRIQCQTCLRERVSKSSNDSGPVGGCGPDAGQKGGISAMLACSNSNREFGRSLCWFLCPSPVDGVKPDGPFGAVMTFTWNSRVSGFEDFRVLGRPPWCNWRSTRGKTEVACLTTGA